MRALALAAAATAASLCLTSSAFAISAVGNVVATPGNNQVALTWTNPADADFDHVNVYRSTTPLGTPTLVQAVAKPATTWTDTTAVNGTDYWYVLRAATAANVEAPDAVPGGVIGTWFTTTTFTAQAGQRLDPTVNYPSSTGANPYGQADNFSVRWEGYLFVPAADTYTIYHNHDNTSTVWIDGVQVMTSGVVGEQSTAIALSPGWHAIRADLVETTGAFAQVLSWSAATLPKEVIPAANLGIERRFQATPRNNTLAVTTPNGGETITTGSTTVSWTSTGLVNRFEISYSLDGGATWGGTIATHEPGASTSREWQLPPGITENDVRIRIRALSPYGVVLASDTSNADFTIDTPPVAPVSNLVATPGSGSVGLTWTNPVDPAFHHVDIYRSTNEGDVGTLVHTTAGPATSSWADTLVVNGTQYFYRVRAVDVDGRSSPDLTVGNARVRWWSGSNLDTYLGEGLSNCLCDSFGNQDGPGPLADAPDWLGYDTFSGRYSGFIYIGESGTYHFRAYRRSGARLWVGTTQVMNEWFIDGTLRDTTSAGIALGVGWHPIRFEYTTDTGDSHVHFQFKKTTDASWVLFDGTNTARETVVGAVPHASVVTVTAPNGGEQLRAQRHETISWTTVGAEANVVDLWYSTDGGATYPYLIVRGQPLSGSYDWIVPDEVNSTQVRVRAVARTTSRTTIATDASNANLTIDTVSAPPPPVTNLQTVAGDTQVFVSWTMPVPLAGADHVRVYRASNEADVPRLVYESPNATVTSWVDTGRTNGTEYWYYVRTVDAAGQEQPTLTNGRVRAAYFAAEALASPKIGVIEETAGFEAGKGYGNSDGPYVPSYPDFLWGDNWSARYSGYVYAPETTAYRVRVYRRIGARLWIDERPVLDELISGCCGTADSTWMQINLTKGYHSFRLDFNHNGSDAFLYWQLIRTSDWAWRDVDITQLATENASSAVPSNASVTVTAPNGGETFGNAGTAAISWNATGSDATAVDLWLSTDGGNTYPILIVRGQPTSGTYQWSLPNIDTTQARVRAVATNANRATLATDSSNADFTIRRDPSNLPPPVQGVSTTAGNGSVAVSWTMPSPLGTTDHVRVYRATNMWDNPTQVFESADTTTTTWNDAAVTNGTRYWYYVRTVDAAGREGQLVRTGRVNAEYFGAESLAPPMLDRVVETTGFDAGRGYGSTDGPVLPGAPDYLWGDTWSARYAGMFSVPTTGTYRIRVYRRVGARLWVDDRQLLNEMISGCCGAPDSDWITVQLTAGWHRYRLDFNHNGSDAFLYFQTLHLGDWAWRDVDTSRVAIEASSDALPTATTVNVTAPNGGEAWLSERYETISWNAAGADASSVALWYSTDGGATYPYLIARGQPMTGSYQWFVPDGISSTQVRVRAVATDNVRETFAADASDANLTINTSTSLPPAVQDVSSVAASGSVQVSWTMPSPLGSADRVRIYRSTTMYGIPTQVHETANATVTSWTDNTVTNGTRYWYYVRTLDAAGREGPLVQVGRVNAEYYAAEGLASPLLQRTIETTGFEGSKGFGTSDGPVVPDAPDYLWGDGWSARYSGKFSVPATTTYRVRVYRRVGARLWIDGRQVLDEMISGCCGAPDSDWIQIQLTAGWHDYRLDFNHNGSDAFLYFQTIHTGDWAWRDVDTSRTAIEQSTNAMPTADAVTVTAPNGGETWYAERRETISWTSTLSEGASVTLWYSTDGGATWPYLIARNQPASGSYTWLVPDGISSTQVRVRAVTTNAARETFRSDASDANLTIDTVTSTPPAVQDVNASASNAQASVTWTMPSPLGTVDHVRVYRATNAWDAPTQVHETANAGVTSWTDNSVVNGTRYWYYVRTVDAAGREGPLVQTGRVNAEYYDGEFFTAFAYESVENYGFESGRGFGAGDFPLSKDNPGGQPNGDTWSARYSGKFSVPATGSYRIRVYRRVGARLWIDGRQVLDEWISGCCGSPDSDWMQVQLTGGWHDYRLDFNHNGSDAFLYFQTLRLADWTWRDVDTSRVAIERSANATPQASTMSITSPTAGAAWSSASDQQITWSATGMPVGTTYRVRYSPDGTNNFERIIAASVTGTSLTWHPPESINSATVRIRVEARNTSGQVIQHADSNAFSILPSALDPVTNLVATPGWGIMTLSWTNPVAASFDHVNVYRSEQPWQLGTKVTTLAKPTSSWVDTGVINGTRYWYTVRGATAADVEAMTLQPGGLRGDYFSGADFGTFVGAQIDPTIDFNWGAGAPALLGATADNFSVRWTGYIRADVDDFWTIDTNRPTRDGARVWVDDTQLNNHWNAGDTDATGTGYMQLQGGWHRITMEYHETTGLAYTGLYHTRTGLARRIVPSSELATERQVSGVPIDPTPPNPNPAGTVQAVSATTIEWSLLAVADAESGLHATPFTYDNGSTWVTDSTYQRTGLAPNTAYTQTLRARDAVGNMTTPNVLTARTHAVNPTVTADRATSTWLGPGSVSVTFSNGAVFGPGGVEYYRYAWTTNSGHTFDATEPKWSSGNLVRTATTSGTYYLHVKSYNADDVGGGQAVLGPFWIDAEAPAPNPPTVTTNATLSDITFTITGASDAHSGLHATPYSFDNGATWQASDVNSATGLAPNTSATRTVRVRDAIGNISTPTVVTAATLPVDPGVTSVPAGGPTWHPGGTTVTVSSSVAFGPGTLWGYRWRTSNDPGAGVLDTDAAWTSGTLPVTLATTGTHYIRARSYNSTGTGGNTATLGPFHVDATPPPGTVPSAPSPTAVAPVISWPAVTDPDSGLSGYRVYRSTSAGALGSQIASVAGTSYTDNATLVDDTTYWYTVQAVDNVANEQTVGNTQIAVTYSSTPPTGSSVTIAGGAGAVTSTSVTLTLASANAVQMQVSNAPDFSGATWEPFAATRGWTLTAGPDGSRTVYARFRNAGGTTSSAVVDTIDVDSTAPTPNPPAVTAIVASATSISWNVQSVTDALVGLPAQPYSLDDGATWQAGTSRTDTALAPNTTYTLQARARDALGNTSGQGTASATTLPAAPAVTSTPAADPLPQPRGTTFTFTNVAGWGAGAVEYYRWAWTTSATHSFTGTEAMWTSGTLARQEFVAGTYYLHVKAYNSDDAAGQELTLGPYGVAPPQNDTELTMNIAATQTISCSTTGFASSFLPGVQQTADVDCNVSSSVAGWNLAMHAGAAPFYTDFLDVGTTPAAWSSPAASDGAVGFTVTGTHALAAFGGGTLWRGFDGATDVRIAEDTAVSGGETITTKVRVELGASSPIGAGTRTQTITYTLNPGT